MDALFSEILGHESVKAGLVHAFNTGRMHHAILMTGVAGIGKSMLARAFVQAIMCEQSTPGHLARCLSCRNCTRIAKGIHPDVIEIDEPTATIKIEVIRDLQQRLSFAPYESERRFVIIQDVHKMQDAAANCLLKTLEEPEAHTTFILITSQVQRLLPTIVSRCQVVRFAPFSFDEVAKFLESHDVSPESANQTAAMAGGSLGAGLELSSGDYKTEVIEAFEKILHVKSTLDGFEIASDLKGKKAMADPILSLLQIYLRDMLVLKVAPKAPIILKHYQPEMTSRIASVSEKNLHRASLLVQEINEAFLGNVNELVAWERLVLGMHGVLFN